MHNWKQQGLCNRYDPDDFYDKYEASVKSDQEEAQEIDKLCQICPVRRLCLATGVSNKEWGVWGGVYLKDGKIDREFNAHKTKQDWFDTWSALTMENEVE